MGIPGGYYNTVHMVDPDIAAQGEEARKTQGQALDWQKQKFNTVMPMLQNQLGQANAGGVPGQMGAPVGQQPHINGAPLWTQQAIQQNVNANRAQIDRSTATSNQNMRNGMAGRGLGAASPLAAALENQSNMSALGQKADYTRQFLPQVRQQNAQFGLDVGNANEKQYVDANNAASAFQQNNIAAQRNAQQYQSSLLQALGGLL
jgi:hypothetical protein